MGGGMDNLFKWDPLQETGKWSSDTWNDVAEASGGGAKKRREDNLAKTLEQEEADKTYTSKITGEKRFATIKNKRGIQI